MLTERGSSFGYNNLVVDMRGLQIMREPDGRSSSTPPTACSSRVRRASSGGQPQFIEPLARAATATGIAGLFVEVHEQPERALSDGANALRLDLLAGLLARLRSIDSLVKSF